jgi:hypothetical protein
VRSTWLADSATSGSISLIIRLGRQYVGGAMGAEPETVCDPRAWHRQRHARIREGGRPDDTDSLTERARGPVVAVQEAWVLRTP